MTFDFSTLTANETKAIHEKYSSIKSTYDPTTGKQVNYTTIVDERKYKIGDGRIHPSKANFLGLIIFSVFVGKIAGGMGERGRPFVEFITAFNEIITQLVLYIMW